MKRQPRRPGHGPDGPSLAVHPGEPRFAGRGFRAQLFSVHPLSRFGGYARWLDLSVRGGLSGE
jgi:hypothetical protein